MEKKKSSWHILGEYAINAIISLMRRVILLIPAIGLMRNIVMERNLLWSMTTRDGCGRVLKAVPNR